MIKLVALDLDGTLLMEDHTIPDDVVAVLQEAASRGVKFAIATGRSFTSSKIFAERLGIDCACICYNGGMVRRMDGSVVLAEPLSAEQVAAITSFCKEKGLYFQCYDLDSILVEKICDWTHRDNDTHLSVVRELGDITKVEPFPSPKMVVFGSEGDLEDALAQLQQRFGDSCHMALSLSFILEVTRKGTTKQTMLARYAELCGIRQEEVMAVGDHLNDLEMVSWAGIGVAVGNAVPGLKEAADCIMTQERSYGVAEAIRKFCL